MADRTPATTGQKPEVDTTATAEVKPPPPPCTRTIEPNKMVFFDKHGERHEIYLPKGTLQKAVDLFQEENWDELLEFPPYTDQGYKDWD